MKRLLLIASLSILALGAKAGDNIPKGEWIIVIGGPSLKEWEKYKTQPHDHWWANFVRAARIRTEQIRAQYGPDQMITWLVYRPGYVERGVQEKQDLTSYIESVRDKFNLHLVWFGPGWEALRYINSGQPRDQTKVGGFEYFGHSNKACFMFDYSNVIDSACKSWLHENDLKKIDRRVFAKRAYVKSWVCHTGECMSQKWHTATRTHTIGAIGKTQLMRDELRIHRPPYGMWANGVGSCAF